jgi:hypothetical protein
MKYKSHNVKDIESVCMRNSVVILNINARKFRPVLNWANRWKGAMYDVKVR